VSNGTVGQRADFRPEKAGLDAPDVLLVEDNRADAELLRAHLAESMPEARLVVVPTLAEAWEHAGSADAVLADLSIPDSHGLDTVSALRALRPDLPLIVLTGTDDVAIARAALRAGAQDYLVKDWLDPVLLERAIRYARDRLGTELRERRLERYAQSLLDAIEAPTCAVNRDAVIVKVNESWRASGPATGAPAGHLEPGASYLEVWEHVDFSARVSRRQVAHSLRQLLAGELPRVTVDYANGPDEGAGWTSLRMNPLPGGGAVLSHIDISELKAAQEALRLEATHDTVTGLATRERFMERFREELAACDPQTSVAVLMIDVDGMRLVNELRGYDAGDAVLRQVAALLTERVGTADRAARMAGDELAAVMTAGSREDAIRLAEDVAADVAAYFAAAAAAASGSAVLPVPVTVSVGVAFADTDDIVQLLSEAEAAVRSAKRSGRGRVALTTPQIRSQVNGRRSMEQELRDALERNEFVVHYQPILGLREGEGWGAEGLVRWRHPTRGLLGPGEFLDVVEHNGLMGELGTWVFREVARHTATLCLPGVCDFLTFNCSALQLADSRFTEIATETVAALRVQPGTLAIELTESTLAADEEAARHRLERLAELGITLSIDDFGTGYSTLLYLKHFPVRGIKIDRSFVAGMVTSADDAAIVSSLVSLAANLGYRVVAEGVETEPQRRALIELGASHAQGFLFSRSVVPEELVNVLARLRTQVWPEPPVDTGVHSVKPWGYARDPSQDALDALDAATKVRMRELLGQGASLPTIAETLNNERHWNPRGQQWHARTLARYIALLSQDQFGD
jgi:diguanylate cyclase (GGDEF)-like protein